MNVWVLKDGEPISIFEENARLMRAGLLCNYLANRNHNITFWTSTWSHYRKHKYIDHDATVIDRRHNFIIKMVDSYGYKKNLSIRRVLHYIKLAIKFYKTAKQMSAPDLIISALPSIELSYAAVYYAKKHKCKILIDCRDMWPDIFMDVLSPKIQRLIKPFIYYQTAMMRYVCKYASGFVGITKPYLSWAAAYAARDVSDNDFVLPLVYPNDEKSKSIATTVEITTALKNKNLDFTNKFTVVFAGTFSKNAFNLESVIKAFKLLPGSCQLVIAGKSLDDVEVQQRYEFLAKDIPNVKLVGWLDKYELHYIYTNSQLGIAPYVNKDYFKMNITNKPIEYLSYGLPVLTSVCGCLSDLLVSHQAGFLYDETKPEDISNLVFKLYQDNTLYENMRENSKLLYDSEFDYDKVMENFVKFLEK
jgi:glycosyltransferase involved in cell wall biosynthesis